MDFSDPDALRQTFERAFERIAALEAQLAATRRPRPVLPDPDKFNGKDYDTWLPLIKAKLDLDGDALGGTEKAFFWYVYGRLEADLQGLVLCFASTPSSTLVFDLFDRIYEDPNKPARAADRLSKLTQGTDTLPRFLAKFERTLFEAGALNWPDSAKVAALRAGLNDFLKRKLDNQLSVPNGYKDFVHTLHQLSGRLKYTPPPTALPDKMDIGAVATTRRLWSPTPKRVSEVFEEDDEEE